MEHCLKERRKRNQADLQNQRLRMSWCYLENCQYPNLKGQFIIFYFQSCVGLMFGNRLICLFFNSYNIHFRWNSTFILWRQWWNFPALTLWLITKETNLVLSVVLKNNIFAELIRFYTLSCNSSKSISYKEVNISQYYLCGRK